MTPGRAGEVFGAFLKLGLTSFGGPVAHLGYFRRELVERRRWLADDQFGQLLAICQFLPGPASSQLGFCLGLVRAGWPGALAAFVAFTLPSAVLLIAFASAVPLLSGNLGQAIVAGLKIVAFAVVADAVRGMAGSLCPDARRRSIAIGAAAILLIAGSPWMQLAVVAGGAVAGALSGRESGPSMTAGLPETHGRTVGAVLLATFVLLLVSLPLLAGPGGWTAVADAFYRAGALVFGGGHVVLPLLEAAVVGPGWVAPEAFLAGYGAAQAVPGPLFTFAGFLGAAASAPGGGLSGAALALAFIFLPGFLLVAGVLPFWRAVAHHRRAASAIAGVNAAVVGLLGAALYDPIFTAGIRDATDLAVGVVAFALLAVWKVSPLWAVTWCVLASCARVLL